MKWEPARNLASALRGDRSSFPLPLPRLLLPILLCLALPWGFNARPVAAQSSTAVVTGAEHVVVRRGPGKGYPPVAALSRGSTVDVQQLRGEWARIVTERGERGYVKSTFLVLPAEMQRHGGAASAPVSSAGSGPAPAVDSAALQERNKALEAEVTSLRQELADLRNRREPTPVLAANPTPPMPEQWQAELARLATAVEGLQRRIDARPVADDGSPSASMDGGGHAVSATSMLFAMIGILVGWLVGGTYGRKQERGRRSRIRF